MSYYQFDCGCKVPIIGGEQYNGLPAMCIDFDNINEDCPDVWDLICSGRTKGVFQLESGLGQNWSAQVKPHNLSEISAIISIIRPGVIKAMFGNKNMAQHYADRKNHLEDKEYLHPCLEPILSDTHSVLLYQEQSMRIATDIADFSLQEADNLRKGLGKKNAKLIAQIREEFVKKATAKGIINEEEANAIYDWIEKGNRYLFNASHSFAYSIIAYWCAWVKVHFPLQFYAAWMQHANEKIKAQEEMRELIFDAKSFDIKINPPSVLKVKKYGPKTCIDSDQVFFNSGDIKGIGEKQIENLLESIKTIEAKLHKDITEWNWNDFLLCYFPLTNKTVVNGLIAAGALDHLNVTRARMIFEYKMFCQLSNGEQQYIVDNYQNGDTLLWCVKNVLVKKTTKSRKSVVVSIIQELEEPPYSLDDTMKEICGYEHELLGVPITYSTSELLSSANADTTCKEFVDGKTGSMSIAVEILEVNSFAIKNGKNKGKKMAKIVCNDDTAKMGDVVVFAEAFAQFQNLLYQGNIVVLYGEKSQKNNQISFVVKTVEQL